ncbi:MAG: hypothetical protein K6A40_07915 [Solobacterium sp.]|nr:hypothetical protein [Solobacterium sp.]
MKMNLYPWNYYILYASILLLVIFIVLTGLKALALLKEVQNVQNATEPMQRSLALMQIKMDAMNEKKAEQRQKNKILMAAIPVLLAMQKVYSSDDTLEGVKGYAGALKRVAGDKAVIDKVKKSL